MAVYKWAVRTTESWFNDEDCRDPNIVFNNTALPYGGPIAGYDNTPYAMDPINFEPHKDTPKANTFTKLGLAQFLRDPITDLLPEPLPKVIKVTGNCGLTGDERWNGMIMLWARAYGSNWNLSPINDSGYQGSFHFPIPVGIDQNGEPAIDIAWGTMGINNTSNWGKDPSLPRVNGAWLNIIMSEWCR